MKPGITPGRTTTDASRTKQKPSKRPRTKRAVLGSQLREAHGVKDRGLDFECLLKAGFGLAFPDQQRPFEGCPINDRIGHLADLQETGLDRPEMEDLKAASNSKSAGSQPGSRIASGIRATRTRHPSLHGGLSLGSSSVSDTGASRLAARAALRGATECSTRPASTWVPTR